MILSNDPVHCDQVRTGDNGDVPHYGDATCNILTGIGHMKLREVSLGMPHLHENLEDFRVWFLTDPHFHQILNHFDDGLESSTGVGYWSRLIQHRDEALTKLKPHDAIVVGGDVVCFQFLPKKTRWKSFESNDSALAQMRRFFSIDHPNKYIVFGNHDRGHTWYPEIVGMLEDLGWTVLHGTEHGDYVPFGKRQKHYEHRGETHGEAHLEVGDASIQITGVVDTTTNINDGIQMTELDRGTQEIMDPMADLRVHVDHNPAGVQHIAGSHANTVYLHGHTHGMHFQNRFVKWLFNRDLECMTDCVGGLYTIIKGRIYRLTSGLWQPTSHLTQDVCEGVYIITDPGLGYSAFLPFGDIERGSTLISFHRKDED